MYSKWQLERFFSEKSKNEKLFTSVFEANSNTIKDTDIQLLFTNTLPQTTSKTISNHFFYPEHLAQPKEKFENTSSNHPSMSLQSLWDAYHEKYIYIFVISFFWVIFEVLSFTPRHWDFRKTQCTFNINWETWKTWTPDFFCACAEGHQENVSINMKYSPRTYWIWMSASYNTWLNQ